MGSGGERPVAGGVWACLSGAGQGGVGGLPLAGGRQGLEQRLPQRPRGYYREYTVRTPDLGHRGARRIVTGGDPPEVWYYTDDHYETFRGFEVPADGGTR